MYEFLPETEARISRAFLGLGLLTAPMSVMAETHVEPDVLSSIPTHHTRSDIGRTKVETTRALTRRGWRISTDLTTLQVIRQRATMSRRR